MNTNHECYCLCGNCWRCGFLDDEVTDSDLFFGDDLIANISRGEEALKGIEPGATFEIAELYGKEN